MIISLIYLCLINLTAFASSPYQSQELSIQRILPPKVKRYPLLEQVERWLYPRYNFGKEHPSKRLERLEIAIFGNKQQGSIKTRLSNIKIEVQSWQIASAGKINKTTKPHPKRRVRQQQTPSAYYQAQYYPVQNRPRANLQNTKTVDYDYQNYRLLSPLLRTIGRRSIEAMFKAR